MNNENGAPDVRSVSSIALEIFAEWKTMPACAKAYAGPMLSLGSVDDAYGLDDGRRVVLGFLCNAQGWRGEAARRIKAELRLALERGGG